MKTTKRILAFFLALLMVTALAVTASAADIDLDQHTFKAYKILDGKEAPNPAYDANTNPNADPYVLTDVAWPSNLPVQALLDAVNPKYGTSFTVDKVAEFAAFVQGVDDPVAFSKVVYDVFKASNYTGVSVQNGTTVNNANNSNFKDGYYLIIDETDDPDAYNIAVLQLVGTGDPVDINPKTTVPTIVKKVQDKNDCQPLATEPWQDSADYDIHDSVPFQVTIHVDGSKLKYYDTYSLKINDTLDPGFDYDVGTLAVYCNNRNISTTLNTASTATNQYSVAKDDTNNTTAITVILKNIKALNGITDGDNVFVITYNATLNEDAVIGCNATTHKGNDNKVDLEYSRNPNRPDYVLDGNNNYKENDDGTDFGQTPPDTVRVFTYQVVVKKLDSQRHALAGAKFKLWKFDPDSYNPANPVNEDGFQTIDLGEPTPTGDPANVFTWTGLDDGVYKLVETKVPAGYNKLDDVVFEVKAAHSQTSDDPVVTSLTCNEAEYDATEAKFVPVTSSDFVATTDIPAGSVTTDVINQSGVVLPETGADGTQMLYILGTALLLGGLVLIVTKKRVGEQS